MATIDLDLDANDLDILRGALLAAKAAELAEFQRRAGRLSYGYGSESARQGMSAELVQLRRRRELLEALIAALDRGSSR